MIESTTTDSTASDLARISLAVSVLISLVGTIGSVFLSVGLGLKACPLCFYQRSFVMAALAVLIMGWFAQRSRPGAICLLSVPLAWAGAGVAAFHEFLVLANVLDCPRGLFNLGSAPAQSLAMLMALAVTTTIGAWGGRRESAQHTTSTLLGAIVLGVILAGASVKSAPPLPPAPVAAYDPVKQPLDSCRRPFVAPKS